MKKLQQAIMAASLMLTAFSSCKKEAANQPVTDPISTASRISKIEHADGSSEMNYNADGSIKEIINKQQTGSTITTYSFSYNNNQIKEVTYGTTKIRYNYTAGFVTKVERLNAQTGTVMHKNEFTYSNTQLVEMIEYWPNGNGGLKSFGKTSFSYSNGNVVKMDLYDFINNAWTKTGEVTVPEYDSKKNTSINFENPVYLPNIELCRNNPLKEVHRNELGTIVQTVTHAYLYDGSNRPTQRTSTTKLPGSADFVETTRFYY